MKFTAIAKLAAVAGVMMASTLVQPVSAHIDNFTLNFGKIEFDHQRVDPQTTVAADLTGTPEGGAIGVIRLQKAGDVTLKRGTFSAARSTVICEDGQPVVFIDGTYTELVNGTIRVDGPARAEVRSRPAGGGGVIIGDFDIIDAAATTTSFEAIGEIAFPSAPCR
ncbi:MAG: hypothetical protein R2844_06720 [Caldilineales bacterium]